MTQFSKLFTAQQSTDIIDVTPEKAADIIARHNWDNRKVKKSVVAKYAKIMADGDWKFSPETISIARSGRMLNGQHRMLAVVESGVTCRFIFAIGFDEDVFEVLDRGAMRTRADALSIDKKLSECATLLCRVSGSDLSSTITDADVYRAAMLIKDCHDELMVYCNTYVRLFSSAPFRLAAVARIMGGYDRDYCMTLYRNLVLSHTEVLPPVGHAIMRAANRGRISGTGGGGTQLKNAGIAWDIFDPKSSAKKQIVTTSRDRARHEISAAIYGPIAVQIRG
jgi:hypothetical protein